MPGEPTRVEPIIRSKRNHTGATIPANTIVKLSATEEHIEIIAATTDSIYGVTMAAIADHEYGDIQIRGRALVRAHGALATPGTRLMGVAATGRCDTWAAGAGTNAQVLGLQENTAAAQDDLVEVELAGPGVISQG